MSASDEVMPRPSGPRIVIRLCLMAAAVWWWSLLLKICSNVTQPDLVGRTVLFNCPISGLAFITTTERNLLYGLVPLCLALVATDFALRKRRARP